MTKNTLLARAKALGITGRHDMSKEDLQTAVTQREMIAETQKAVKVEVAHSHGKKLVRNTNIPWKPKFYFISEVAYAERVQSEEIKKAPMQVQLLLKSMIARGVTSSDKAQQGGEIAGAAINSGAVKTSIEPHVLFAYYRKKMENLGLVFAGYAMEDEGGEAPESDELDQAAEADETAAESEETEV